MFGGKLFSTFGGEVRDGEILDFRVPAIFCFRKDRHEWFGKA